MGRSGLGTRQSHDMRAHGGDDLRQLPGFAVTFGDLERETILPSRWPGGSVDHGWSEISYLPHLVLESNRLRQPKRTVRLQEGHRSSITAEWRIPNNQ
jgi:hypothetical protein